MASENALEGYKNVALLRPRLRHYEGLWSVDFALLVRDYYSRPAFPGRALSRKAPTRVRGKDAKDGKEDWLWENRTGNRANDAGRVTSSDREGGDIFCNDGASADDNSVT